MQAQWYYEQAGQPIGPVSGEDLCRKVVCKAVPVTTLVWRAGMATWVPAGTIPALTQGVALSPSFIADRTVRSRMRIIKNARKNAIAMFGVLILWAAFMVFDVVVMFMSGSRLTWGVCFEFPGQLSGWFAAIYLPLRWQVLRNLPRPFGILGLIGGIGLVALLLMTSLRYGIYMLMNSGLI